jgi:DNA repair protein RadD
MIELRDYQTAMIEGIRAEVRAGNRAVVLQLPTGGGKTITGSFMIAGSIQREKVCWWLSHRRELIGQTSRTFASMGIPHGIISAGHSTDPHKRAQIGSIQTVARRLEHLTPPDVIVFDEVHHIGASQWAKIFEAFPEALKIGLTATPWRLDGKGLGNWFSAMVQGPTSSMLMEQGALSNYRLFAPSQIDTSAVKMQAGDYKKPDLAELMDKPAITGDAVDHYRRLAHGKRAVAFAVSIEHSMHVVAQFRANGIAAEHVDGGMDIASRDAAVQRFVAGETLVLSNCELFGEGFDVPAIEAAILLRPTKSLSLHLQQVGRALRPAPGKTEAIILDHAGNTLIHGLPDDEREWTLDDREKRRAGDKGSIAVRTCTECFRVYRPAPKCPACGHGHEAQGREIEQREGTLAEIDQAAIKRQRKDEERKAETLDDLIRIGQQRGYKNPAGWARNYFAARQTARDRYQPERRWA